jgi:zinc transporter ZupT
MNTLYLSISLFALGAIIGTYLLSFVLQKKEIPKLFAFIHGAFVVIAFILLIHYGYQHEAGLIESIILFVVAALGGITLIIRDVTGKSLPKWLAISHGLIAVTGFTSLFIYAFNK